MLNQNFREFRDTGVGHKGLLFSLLSTSERSSLPGVLV
jgi:hypothetical protein